MRPGRGPRRSAGGLAGGVARRAVGERGSRAAAAVRRGGAARAGAVVARRAAGRRRHRGARRRDGHRDRARPGRRGEPGRGRSLGAGRPAGGRLQRRGAAGCVHPGRAGLVAAALAPGSPRRGRLRALPGDAAHGAPARRRVARRPCAGAVPAVVGARGDVPDRGGVRPVRPRGADRHPAARGRARGRRGDRRGPRDRRALGARLPARARGLRHLGAVVRARLVGRGAAPRALARAVPGLGHHARPAADRGLPGRGPRRPARLAGPAGARGRGGAGRARGRCRRVDRAARGARAAARGGRRAGGHRGAAPVLGPHAVAAARRGAARMRSAIGAR